MKSNKATSNTCKHHMSTTADLVRKEYAIIICLIRYNIMSTKLQLNQTQLRLMVSIFYTHVKIASDQQSRLSVARLCKDSFWSTTKDNSDWLQLFILFVSIYASNSTSEQVLLIHQMMHSTSDNCKLV